MSSYDYDVIVIGSGFGGSVSAMRAAEKGYSVGVLEAGRRMTEKVRPKSTWDVPHFVWFPGLELYGIQRVQVLDDTMVMGGAGVGGGSLVYAQTMFVPPENFFESKEWAGIADWATELAPFYDLAQRMLGVQMSPYMPNDIDRVSYKAAKQLGLGDWFNMNPQAAYFGEPGVEVKDPYFGGVGPTRTGCVHCGNCMVGCGKNSKNLLTDNYLYLAEKRGAKIHEFHEVYEIEPLPEGGFLVHARHPGWAHRAVGAGKHTYRAEQVIVSAHAYGTSKLLTHMRHDGKLGGLSEAVGHRARTNSEQMLAVTMPHDVWAKDPNRFKFIPGSVGCTSATWPDDSTSCEPCFYGTGNNAMAMMLTWHQEGDQEHPMRNWLKHMITNPSEMIQSIDKRNWSERSALFNNMQSKNNYLDLYWDGHLLRSREPKESQDPLKVHIPSVENFIGKVCELMGPDVKPEAVAFEVINKNASAHFIGGMVIGTSGDDGVIDAYQRAFGHPGLHIIDGSVMPANPGVNPSLTITALAERAMSMWPNKGDSDRRAALGKTYEPVAPIMPHKPVVPPDAHSAYRLNVTKEQIIPKTPADFGKEMLNSIS